MGVSDDTVRRWVDTGRLPAQTESGLQVIPGSDVAALARSQVVESGRAANGSARNRIAGIVTEVIADQVMAQVEIAAGRYRIVSLMSREAVEELGLEPGVLATAVIKATMVTVEGDSGAQA